MADSTLFYQIVTDSVAEHICVIDEQGRIVFSNAAWRNFADQNGLPSPSCVDYNYLRTCDLAATAGDDSAAMAATGIRQVIAGERERFYFEYPCHSPARQRWFSMCVTASQRSAGRYFVISHQDITQRKQAEDRVLQLSRTDALTQLANRRYFDERLEEEWRRCMRYNLPLALVLIDVDYFKDINDHYGHQAGDACLQKVAEVLGQFAHRPGDLCGRYGGDEFALLLSDTTLEQALALVGNLPALVRELDIPNAEAPTGPTVTVSAGLAKLRPVKGHEPGELVQAADAQLYQAKTRGRNQLVYDRLRLGPSTEGPRLTGSTAH